MHAVEEEHLKQLGKFAVTTFQSKGLNNICFGVTAFNANLNICCDKTVLSKGSIF
jgi:hypothetical protein